jgi:hypothetical protein
MIDLICECGERREVVLKNRGDNVDEEDKTCPSCGSTKYDTVTVGGHQTKLNSPEQRDEALKKRSEEHSAKHMKANWDRLVDTGKIPGAR